MSAREFLTDPLILARLAEQAARDEAHQFRLLADNVPVAIAYYESAGFTCQYANRGYAQTFGWNEQSIIGHTVADVIGEEAARFIQPQVDQVLKQRTPAMYERQLATAAGLRFIEVHLLPHLDREGKPMGAFVLISDISKHRLAERAVRESEERLAKFMQASAEGIVFHKGGLITDANPPILALTGYTIDEMVGRHVFEFIAPEHVSRVQTVMGAGQELAYELEILDRQRRRIPVEFIVRTMERHGERLRMTIVRDIRDRRAAQAHIRHLAHHDALTGLPNRTAFMERASALLAEGQRDDQTLAMLFIDLDHFKRVNDSLGHIAGDSLLQTIAARLSASLRTGDLVARFGGDEFMVLLPGDLPRADVEAVASKLLAAIEAPLELHNTSISVSPTIGVALFPRDGSTPVELIKHADTAMYYAKSRGRATCEFFEPEMESEAYAALLMEGELARAIERGEFELHFQPQLRLIDNAIVGAEALIRWRHPVRGLLLPDAFIPVAEERRLMLPIGQWVMREAARCARRWRDAGLAALPVAVNLSTLQFQSPRFVESVEQVLLQERALGTHLELELTERMLMDDMPAVRRMLHRLKLLGVRIAVDDFGTGYTSLVHLKDLPIDRVKIDRAFVKDLPGNAGCAAIARSIIQLAHGLGMEVVAEGVELPAQRAWLDEHGCDHLQGYVLARAMPAAQFEAWLKSHAAASGSATS